MLMALLLLRGQVLKGYWLEPRVPLTVPRFKYLRGLVASGLSKPL